MEPEDVDLVVLTRDNAPLSVEVQRAIDRQAGVRLHVHRVIGTPQPGDLNRWETIARARNRGKKLGRSPWVMFLDDDVELEPDAIAQLLQGLRERPAYGALAADYFERHGQWPSRHVAMGATLFRRQALELITFRWSEGVCECQCCCDDLRRHSMGIDYLPRARGRHLKDDLHEKSPEPARHVAEGREPSAACRSAPPRLLVAFDRRHLGKFRRQFLGSLHRAGNHDPITVIGYGLYPSEVTALEAIGGMEVLPRPVAPVMVPVIRLRHFQEAVRGMAPDTPVAYWDAGDVVFQDSLEPLWQIIRNNPSKLLAAREPRGHPDNAAVSAWTLSIRDPQCRARAFKLLTTRPFLNSGFAAGTARTMLDYFCGADRLRNSAALEGTTDWGDQVGLNLYCHSNPDAWMEVSESWNYCVHDRLPGEVRVDHRGRLVNTRGIPIHVAHGNAHSLRFFEASFY